MDRGLYFTVSLSSLKLRRIHALAVQFEQLAVGDNGVYCKGIAQQQYVRAGARGKKALVRVKLQRLGGVLGKHPYGVRILIAEFVHRRLGALMQQKLQRPLPLGTLDINLYRDDWTSLEGKPHIGQSRITAPVDNAEIILIDDVLFSGRTIRAALEALLDYGRPRKVELLVLVDRGHRELPIQADYIGRSVDTRPQEQVDVLLEERDGRDEVLLTAKN